MKALYPPIPLPELITTFAEWGISVSDEQLKHPTPEFVETLYCACLEEVTGLNFNALREPVQNALIQVGTEDKDLYAAALSSNVILYHLTRFATAARAPDFNSKDLSNPEHARTVKFLSAFINFVRFAKQHCEEFINPLKEHSENLVVQRDKVAAQMEDTQTKINELNSRIAQDKPVYEKLARENQEIIKVLLSNQESHSQIEAEIHQRKIQKNDLVARKKLLNEEVKTVEDAIAHARGRIVQSPERLKRTVDTMNVRTMELRKEISTNEAKSRDLSNKINALSNIEKDVRKCIEELETIEKEIHSTQTSQKALTDQQDGLRDRQIERNELHMRQNRAKEQLTNAQEKMDRAQKHAAEKKVQNQERIYALQREMDQMVIERRENDKEIDAVQEEANEIQKQMNEHLKQSEAELNELLAEYWKLRHETDVYMETLANKLNMKVIAQ